jgi:hypothetical protein
MVAFRSGESAYELLCFYPLKANPKRTFAPPKTKIVLNATVMERENRPGDRFYGQYALTQIDGFCYHYDSCRHEVSISF